MGLCKGLPGYLDGLKTCPSSRRRTPHMRSHTHDMHFNMTMQQEKAHSGAHAWHIRANSGTFGNYLLQIGLRKYSVSTCARHGGWHIRRTHPMVL